MVFLRSSPLEYGYSSRWYKGCFGMGLPFQTRSHLCQTYLCCFIKPPCYLLTQDLSDAPLESLLFAQNGPFFVASLLQQESDLGSASAEGMVGPGALFLVPNGLRIESSYVLSMSYIIVHLV